ncbi:MAG TPA: glutathione S-transferase family protein [Gammaproteobacteria bacterium]
MAGTLYIGDRSISSWSLRGALLVQQSGIDCREQVIPLDRPDTRRRIGAVSPSGRVPVLHYRDMVIWDTLAIAEYLHDEVPEAGLWPDAPRERAIARSISAEMHAGFTALRSACPMELRAERLPTPDDAEVRADVERIEAIWTECRNRFGGSGDFLFGRWCAADAMFAPVVSRFRTYGVPLGAAAQRYADAVWEWPAVRRWVEQAREEPWVLDNGKP